MYDQFISLLKILQRSGAFRIKSHICPALLPGSMSVCVSALLCTHTCFAWCDFAHLIQMLPSSSIPNDLLWCEFFQKAYFDCLSLTWRVGFPSLLRSWLPFSFSNGFYYLCCNCLSLYLSWHPWPIWECQHLIHLPISRAGKILFNSKCSVIVQL